MGINVLGYRPPPVRRQCRRLTRGSAARTRRKVWGLEFRVWGI
jgi:hypothetical protein